MFLLPDTKEIDNILGSMYKIRNIVDDLLGRTFQPPRFLPVTEQRALPNEVAEGSAGLRPWTACEEGAYQK